MRAGRWALGDEIPAAVDRFSHCAGVVRGVSGAVAHEYLAGHTSMIRRDPIGVVASIAPWNDWLMMAAWTLAPALAAGNTCVIKPSGQTPLSTLLLAQVVAQVMAEILPKGLVNVIAGRAPASARPWSNTRKWRRLAGPAA